MPVIGSAGLTEYQVLSTEFEWAVGSAFLAVYCRERPEAQPQMSEPKPVQILQVDLGFWSSKALLGAVES